MWFALCLAAVVLYFATNIRGYYRFKELCAQEGGLRVYQHLTPNVGWQAKKHWGHMGVAHMERVAFARYSDNGTLLDMRYRAGPTGVESSYEIKPADEPLPVVYELRSVNESLPGELRTSRSGYEVREIATGKLLVRWYQIGFSMFDQDKTLLAAPSGQACSPVDGFWDSANQAKYFAPK
jgi:hypothetical protein